MKSETGFLEFDGARIYYEVAGQGDPVVLVHAGIANLRMWDRQVAVLADRYRVIRYDCRGFGRTETEAVPFSNRADLAALLDHLGEPSASVVGISRGGMIVLDFSIERPERVRSLIVVAGGVGGFDPGDDGAVDWDEVERWETTGEWETLSDWETAYWVDGSGQPADRVDPALRAQVHDWILSNYRALKVQGTPQPLDPPAATRLGEVRIPTLVIVGTLDEPATQVSCAHLASNVPGARLETFEGVAHMVNLEQPDRFNRVLTEFLALSRA
jgi:3-oxoadipate enol-lactonase